MVSYMQIIIIIASALHYLVKQGTRAVTVDLVARTCNCRVFDLTGVPCCHVVAVIHDNRQQPLDFVSEFYKREKYLETYNRSLGALKGQEYWQVHSTDEMLPPDIPHKLRGRPKKLRRREEWEGGSRCISSQQQGTNLQRFTSRRRMHCSKYGESGHRKNKCKKNMTMGQPGEHNDEETGGQGGDAQTEQDGEHKSAQDGDANEEQIGGQSGGANDEQAGGQPKEHATVRRPKLPVRKRLPTVRERDNAEHGTGQKKGVDQRSGKTNQPDNVKVFARRKLHTTSDIYCLEGKASKNLEEELRGPLINDYKSTMDCINADGSMRWWTPRFEETLSGQYLGTQLGTSASSTSTQTRRSVRLQNKHRFLFKNTKETTISLDDDQDPPSEI